VSAPRPKREPSRLGRLIFGIALLALGMLGIADLAGVPVPGVFYVAAALAIVGVGLVVGAWFGRARGYIAIGIILSLLLPIVSDEGHRDRTVRPGSVSWTPLTAAEISDSYNHRFGDATLDLSNVDFNGHDVDIDVGISFGELRVIVPDKVDVTVDSDVNLGDAQVFGQDSSGAGVEQTFRDDGADGAGGGSLHIRLHVSFAHAEVDR